MQKQNEHSFDAQLMRQVKKGIRMPVYNQSSWRPRQSPSVLLTIVRRPAVHTSSISFSLTIWGSPAIFTVTILIAITHL